MRFVLALAVIVAPVAAAAAPMIVEGTVLETSAKWVGDGDRIITEAIVMTPSGPVTVSQLGGHVDGLTMRVSHSPELLVPGMKVAVSAHRADDLSARTHVVVDDVRVLELPPGFVRTGPTKAGNKLYWESGCAFLVVNSEGTKELPGDAEFALVEQAVATWNDGIASCSYMKIQLEGREAREVGRDKVNTLVFRDAAWCRPAVKNDPPRCHQNAAAGITTTVYVDDATSPRDGAIVDADIELNGKDFAISNEGATLGAATCQADLLNTLVHELGHFLGLEHTCLADGDPDRIDGTGAPVPACDRAVPPLPGAIVDATMYPYQDCGETKKGSLEPDDIEGVCAIYPKADDPGTCEPVDADTGCCSAGSAPNGAALLLAGLGMMYVFGRRRPRR